MIRKNADGLVISYTHPLGMDICYSPAAVIEESMPLQIRDLIDFCVNIRRRGGSWNSSVHGFDVRIESITNNHMVVNLLDDMGEPMYETTNINLEDIIKIEVL
jgi:hypothetical protein